MSPIRITISVWALTGLALVLAGCHLLFPFEPDAPQDLGPAERRQEADGAVDAARPDAPRLDADVIPWPFSAPALVTVNGPGNDEDPSLTGDLLEIYFTSDRLIGAGAKDIWFSTRTGAAAAWTPPQALAALNTSTDDYAPRVSVDGLQLHFGRLTPTNNHDIFVSSRASRGAPWGPATAVPLVNSLAVDYPGHPDRGLTLLPVVSNRSGGTGGFDIYAALRVAGGQWATPVPIAGINTVHGDKDAWISGDLKVLYFASNRSDSLGYGIYAATRADPTAAFSTPAPVSALNVDAVVDEDPWLSPDLMQIYFASRRGTGVLNIYHATRQAP